MDTLRLRQHINGCLIALDGLCCIGKTTIAKELEKYLRSGTRAVHLYEFPREHSPLQDKLGVLSEKARVTVERVSPHFTALANIVEMGQMRHRIVSNLLKDTITIVTPYAGTNAVYHASLYDDPHTKSEVHQFLKLTAYETLGLPKPDIAIVLTSAHTAKFAKGLWNKKQLARAEKMHTLFTECEKSNRRIFVLDVYNSEENRRYTPSEIVDLIIKEFEIRHIARSSEFTS